MEETKKETENKANAKPAQSSMPDGLDPQQLYEKSIEELHELAAKQVSVADTTKPTTMTEILADPKGEFALKAQELGLVKEFETFVGKQENIAKLREQYLEVEEKRGADADRVANIAPQLQQEANAVRKSGAISAIAGAVVVGAGAAFGANKANQTAKKQGMYGVIGAVVGGIVAGVVAIKRRTKKSVDALEKQMADFSQAEANPALDKQSAELESQLGQAQQESFEGLVNAMAICMTETTITTKMNELASQAQQAEQAAREQAAQNKPEAPAEQAATEPKAQEPHAAAENKASTPQAEQAHMQVNADHPAAAEAPKRVGGHDQGEVPPGPRAEAELARRARPQEASVATR